MALGWMTPEAANWIVGSSLAAAGVANQRGDAAHSEGNVDQREDGDDAQVLRRSERGRDCGRVVVSFR